MKNLMKMVTTSLVVLMSLNALAEDPKINGHKHPRRKEVVDRAEKEKAKNDSAAVNGKITDAQAKKLDKQDNRIERQEQADAKKNGGHITKAEQKQLNREENHVNQERRGMEKKDAAAAATPAPTTPAATTPASN